ncbi:MAG TPA: RNA polymerase sigma factor [Acidimicrobiales bacterium]|jgi:RNA polymerase sigma-70 factor (ECF subfamily)
MKRSRSRRNHHDEDLRRRFEDFYRLHFVALSRYVTRRLPPASREEIVAAAFVVAWKKFSEVGNPTLPWLYRIASFEVSNERRRLGREPELVALWDVSSTDTFPLHDVIDVSSAYAQLSEDDQEVLRLVFWEDLSRNEVAEVLGCSVNALNVRVHRAIDRLRGAISRVGSITKPNHMKEES